QRGRGRAGGQRGDHPVWNGQRSRARSAAGSVAAEAWRQAGIALRGCDARHGGGVHERAAAAASCLPIVEGSSGGEPMVPELIERLERWLVVKRPDYYARLQPGVTNAALDAFETHFSLRLPHAF